MDKPKLTIREIIFEGIKKFAGEIIGVVLLACFLWFFPSLKSLFTEHTFPEKNESQSEFQRELEAHRKEEERLKEELKRHEEALKEAESKKVAESLRAAEAKKAEEARQKTEAPKAKAENTEPSSSSIQPVKADASGVVKAQQEKQEKEAATQAKQKSGAELLREVLEKYGPEDFFSATLNPKIFYEKNSKKPYVQITEKFNQSVFWDKFLPELRNALDGVAVKKSKQFYEDKVRNANQTLNKQGYFEPIYGYGLSYPYQYKLHGEHYKVIVPDNVDSFTVYDMPMEMYLWSQSYSRMVIASLNRERLTMDMKKLTPEQQEIGIALLQFIQKMCRPLRYSITYLDNNGDVISVQFIRKKQRAFIVYRSFNNDFDDMPIWATTMSFAPGYLFDAKAYRWEPGIEALSTENYNAAHPEEGYTVALNTDELKRLDSMKFEVVFE